MRYESTAYLTVIDWPPGMVESERISVLVDCAGMDAFQAKLATRRNTPGIMCEIDAAFRERIVNAIHARGVLCIAPTHDEIDLYPDAEMAMGVEQFPDADPPRFVVNCENQQPWTFTSEQVWLIVVGRLRATKMHVEVDSPGMGYQHWGRDAFDLGHESVPIRQTHTRIRPVIDLHIRSDRGPRLVRLIGMRTRIGIVGESGPPALIDQAPGIDLIEALMPGVRIDREFLDFDPPHSLRRIANKRGGDSRVDKPEYWSFYSPWVAQIRMAMGD